MKYLLVLIAASFLFVACLKTKPEFDGTSCSGNCFIITGRVSDTPSNGSLSGVAIKVYFRYDGYDLFGDKTKYLGNTTSDKSGNYTFRFDASKYRDAMGYYYLQATKDGYLYDALGDNTVGGVFYLDTNQVNIPYVRDFSLYRKAAIKVHFKADSIINFNFLTFDYQYGTAPGTGLVLNGGRTIDTTVTFPTAGDINTFIQWNAAGNGVSIAKKDTLFITRGGTAQYEVNL